MIDVTDATFQAEVIEKSAEMPVVIDLWAEWCGPCKQLTPILEKVLGEHTGKVHGVKIDIDANPGVAQAFQVQSIPMVVALRNGQPVDAFMGAQGEPQVRQFVEKLLPTEEETALAGLIEMGDEASLRAAIEADPDNEEAILTLAELVLGDGRPDEALELVAKVPESARSRHIAALARTGSSTPADDVDAKLAGLLPQVKADETARQEFLDLLEVLGPDDPRTGEWRRKLSSTLF